ncbi:hypothetical protein FA13DRAFT_1723861 [Coprinellus micaceus]|uniref:F-box domain-containing protein n=1 Tax=Coprinellus micaceus TaxID=71717 RepID=A0A4Y7TZN9_COPMI|nr:hypothetical protein FA13DRAFT_1723861 [Coprinellus micaceus]
MADTVSGHFDRQEQAVMHRGGLEGGQRQNGEGPLTLSRMPLEILGNILAHSQPGELDDEARRNLLDLCLVSRTWRDTALSTHELWEGVEIDYPVKDLALYKVADWFNRSGVLGRTLVVQPNWHHDGEDEGDPCWKGAEVLAKLLTEGPPLEHLILDFEDAECFINLTEAIAPQGPSTRPRPWDDIRHLSLSLGRRDYSWKAEQPPNFNHLPPVSSFSLWLPFNAGLDRAVLDTPISIPPSFISNLTSLAIGCDWQVTHHLTILQHATNLERLTISPMGSSFEYLDEGTYAQLRAKPVILPKTRILRLCDAELESVQILPLLRIPMLKEFALSLDLEVQEEDDDEEHFTTVQVEQWLKPFLNQHPSIERLEIVNIIRMDEDALSEILSVSLPLLNNLTFYNVKFDPIAMDLPKERSCFNARYPQLKTIRILKLHPSAGLAGIFQFAGAEIDHFEEQGSESVGTENRTSSLEKLEVTFIQSPSTIGDEGPDLQDYMGQMERLRAMGVVVVVGPG